MLRFGLPPPGFERDGSRTRRAPPRATLDPPRGSLDDAARSYHRRACGYLAGLHSRRSPDGGGGGDCDDDVDDDDEDDEDGSTTPEFESFESAWDALRDVPDDLLRDFEDELWETQSRRFVHGTKRVSVIDAVVDVDVDVEARPGCDDNGNDDDDDDEKEEGRDGTVITTTMETTAAADARRVFRYLVLNERPDRIQTAVEVPRVGAPYRHYRREEGSVSRSRLVSRPPSPLSQTHLGGLAMALPFWRKTNGIASKTSWSGVGAPSSPSPNCLLIGAGGCSLAHALAADLFLEGYNDDDGGDGGGTRRPRTTGSSSDRDGDGRSYENADAGDARPAAGKLPVLKVVEPCPEVLRASRLWFGAGPGDQGVDDDSNRNNSNNAIDDEYHHHNHHHPVPPFFDLVESTGETYLESLLETSEEEKKKDDDDDGGGEGVAERASIRKGTVDVLIVDAEDGAAPPRSMRTPGFWNDLVLPSLSFAGGGSSSSPVVAVNAIGTASETAALVGTMREAFDRIAAAPNGESGGGSEEEERSEGGYAILAVDPPPEAGVSDRHKLVFALPRNAFAGGGGGGGEILGDDDLKGLVDLPRAWAKQVAVAIAASEEEEEDPAGPSP